MTESIRVYIEKVSGPSLVRKALSFSYGICSNMPSRKLFDVGHTIERLCLYAVYLGNIPTEVSVHLVRHSQTGQFHLVKSHREDWTGSLPEEVTRKTPVNHFMMLNARHFKDISNVRLCNKALGKTRLVWKKVIEELAKVEPDLAGECVPQCYRCGYCVERDKQCVTFRSNEAMIWRKKKGGCLYG